MASKLYTAQEMREEAKCLDFEYGDHSEEIEMLNQAADIIDRLEKAIKSKKALAEPSCANCIARCIGHPNNKACGYFIENAASVIEYKTQVEYLTNILRGDEGKGDSNG